MTVSSSPSSVPALDPKVILAAREHAVSEKRLRGVLEELVELHSLAVQMNQGADAMEIIHIALEGAQSRLGIDRLAVFLTEDGEEIRGTWGTDEEGRLVREDSFAAKIKELPRSAMVERALREQFYVSVKENVSLHLGDKVVGTGWNAMIALWYGDEALGWIACDNLIHHRPLAPLQIEVLKLLGAALSQALVRGRAEEKLRQLNRDLEERVLARTAELNTTNEALEVANAELRKLSHSDGLTGLANRRLFDKTLETEWARLSREDQDLAVVLIDVDYFKQYNDELGHLEGDEALRRIASCLKNNVWRPADLVARYGGEEFVLLLPNTSVDGAEAIADRLRRAVVAMHLPHPRSQISRYLTISLGVAVVRAGQKTAEQLVERADTALYEAKREGRNRLVLAAET